MSTKFLVLFLHIFSCRNFFLGFSLFSSGLAIAIDEPTTIRINDDFFGMHIRWGAISTPWPFVRFHSWRVITPETEWRGLQPQRDVWKFESLDQAIALSEKHNVDVILTLGQTPSWASARPTEPSANGLGFSAEPKNIADWEKYVRTVISRYRGRIKFYELWNEPYYSDLRGYTTKGHFSGSVTQMIELAKITRNVINELDPHAKLISPSCTGGESIGLDCTEAFLKAGGGKLVDVIGFHFYMLPERIPRIAKKIHTLMRKYEVQSLPLWNTESGYLVNGTDKATATIPNLGDPFDFVVTQDALPGYVLRAMLLSAVSGISRYYHFSWDIPTMHLMWKKGIEPTPASTGYAQSVRWLRGTTIVDMKIENGIASSGAISRTGHNGILVWSTNGTRKYTVPHSFNPVGYEKLSGSYVTLDSTKIIEIDESPILIRQERTLW